MAGVNGALFSLRASGQLGKAIVFSRWKGIDYARSYVVPANPKSVEQTKTRNAFTATHEIYKQGAPQFRETWEFFARGKKFTSWNAFSSKNIPLLRTASNMDNMVFVEGAGGGIEALDITATPGSGSVDVTISAPPLPAGWALVSGFLVLIQDVDPHGDLTDQMLGHTVASPGPYTYTFTGLAHTTKFLAGGWFKYTKADGKFAYGQSLQATATTT